MDAFELPTMALEVPPRDSVLGADNDRIRAEAGRQSLGHGGQAMGLERHKDRAGATHRREVVGRVNANRPLGTAVADTETRLPHRFQMRATCDEGDVDARTREPRTQESSDGSRADDPYFQACASCSATNRR